jgi:hypothetical protein
MAIHAATAVHDVSETVFDASRDAMEARGGTLTVGAEDGEATVVATVPTTIVQEDPPSVLPLQPGAQDAA